MRIRRIPGANPAARGQAATDTDRSGPLAARKAGWRQPGRYGVLVGAVSRNSLFLRKFSCLWLPFPHALDATRAARPYAASQIRKGPAPDPAHLRYFGAHFRPYGVRCRHRMTAAAAIVTQPEPDCFLCLSIACVDFAGLAARQEDLTLPPAAGLTPRNLRRQQTLRGDWSARTCRLRGRRTPVAAMPRTSRRVRRSTRTPGTAS